VILVSLISWCCVHRGWWWCWGCRVRNNWCVTLAWTRVPYIVEDTSKLGVVLGVHPLLRERLVIAQQRNISRRLCMMMPTYLSWCWRKRGDGCGWCQSHGDDIWNLRDHLSIIWCDVGNVSMGIVCLLYMNAEETCGGRWNVKGFCLVIFSCGNLHSI